MMRHRSSRQVNRGRLRNKWKRKIRKISEINAKLESMKKETDVANILVRDMKKKSEEIKWKKKGKFKRLQGKCYIQTTDQGDARYSKLVFFGKRKDKMELKACSKI